MSSLKNAEISWDQKWEFSEKGEHFYKQIPEEIGLSMSGYFRKKNEEKIWKCKKTCSFAKLIIFPAATFLIPLTVANTKTYHNIPALPNFHNLDNVQHSRLKTYGCGRATIFIKLYFSMQTKILNWCILSSIFWSHNGCCCNVAFVHLLSRPRSFDVQFCRKCSAQRALKMDSVHSPLWLSQVRSESSMIWENVKLLSHYPQVFLPKSIHSW